MIPKETIKWIQAIIGHRTVFTYDKNPYRIFEYIRPRHVNM